MPRKHTQFPLKQSWEQKKLSFIPSLRHVGHCNDPASFLQSAPRHFFLEGGSAGLSAMVAFLKCNAEGCRIGEVDEWQGNVRLKVQKDENGQLRPLSNEYLQMLSGLGSIIRCKEKRFSPKY